MITVSELVSVVKGARIEGDPQTEINKVEVDSRLITANDMLLAVPGYSVDGMDFIPDAIASGAVAVVAPREFEADVLCKVIVPDIRSAIAWIIARFYDYPSSQFKLVGITGTNGKTTITYMTKAILQQRQLPVGLIGTLGYSTAEHQFEATNTTPGPLELERLFTIMASERLRYAVMEVSSHALAMKRVEALKFDVVAISNVTQDHLDFHGTFEDYRAAKAEIISLVEGSEKWVVLNMDDASYEYLFKRINSSYMTFSMSDSKAEIGCEDLTLTDNGSDFTLKTPLGDERVHLPLLGRFNVENALCAAACALAVGLDPMNIASGLAKCTIVAGRAQRIDAEQPFTILIDYAHTPDALSRVLSSARELCRNKLVVLFGCGGDRDKTKRAPMGKAASSLADVVIVTSDNPRSENPNDIIEDIKPGLDRTKLTIIEPDRRTAIETALELCEEDDLLVVAGKGHEDYQIIGGEKTHFDDREIIEEYLKEKQG